MLMKTTLIAAAAAVTLTLALPALAQDANGTAKTGAMTNGAMANGSIAGGSMSGDASMNHAMKAKKTRKKAMDSSMSGSTSMSGGTNGMNH
jgi:pentapeptide MXKDX repeat protein